MEEPIKVNVRSAFKGGKRNVFKGLSRDAIDRYMTAVLKESSELIRDYARDPQHHRYRDDTGRLTRAIKYRLLDKAKEGRTARKGERYKAEVYVDTVGIPDEEGSTEFAFYGRYQHEGHKKRIIKPINGSRLVFYSRRYGRWYRLMAVRGIAKDQFLHRARRSKRTEVLAIFDRELRRLINGEYD